jgi:hypothetical protein
MSETRNHYGIPVPGSIDTLDPLTCPPAVPGGITAEEPIQPPLPVGRPLDYADPDDEEPDSWRDELPDAQRLIYDALMRRVSHCVDWRMPHADTVWLVEETLYQLARLWHDLGQHGIDLPGIGPVRAARPERL